MKVAAYLERGKTYVVYDLDADLRETGRVVVERSALPKHVADKCDEYGPYSFREVPLSLSIAEYNGMDPANPENDCVMVRSTTPPHRYYGTGGAGMSRDDARAVFAAAGLTYYDITESHLVDLRNMLDSSMKASGLMDGTYRMRRLKPRFKGTHQRPWADLRCRSDYFDDREAVTFNPDGFVGFAGWADDTNVQPILAGFCEWVASLSTHP